MTWLLVVALILVLLDDFYLRRDMDSRDIGWRSAVGAKDEKIRRLKRRLRRLLSAPE